MWSLFFKIYFTWRPNSRQAVEKMEAWLNIKKKPAVSKAESSFTSTGKESTDEKAKKGQTTEAVQEDINASIAVGSVDPSNGGVEGSAAEKKSSSISNKINKISNFFGNSGSGRASSLSSQPTGKNGVEGKVSERRATLTIAHNESKQAMRVSQEQGTSITPTTTENKAKHGAVDEDMKSSDVVEMDVEDSENTNKSGSQGELQTSGEKEVIAFARDDSDINMEEVDEKAEAPAPAQKKDEEDVSEVRDKAKGGEDMRDSLENGLEGEANQKASAEGEKEGDREEEEKKEKGTSKKRKRSEKKMYDRTAALEAAEKYKEVFMKDDIEKYIPVGGLTIVDDQGVEHTVLKILDCVVNEAVKKVEEGEGEKQEEGQGQGQGEGEEKGEGEGEVEAGEGKGQGQVTGEEEGKGEGKVEREEEAREEGEGTVTRVFGLKLDKKKSKPIWVEEEKIPNKDWVEKFDRRFEPGTIVWTKYHNSPWWPSRVASVGEGKCF